MRIHRIRLENYRGVDEAEIEPALDGVTVVQGPNEVGKSSLIEAVDLIFRRKDRSSAQRVEAIQPKNHDVGPKAEVEISTGPYRFIYSKRWLKNEETKLQILEPKKDNLTGDKAHERANEILEETLDVDLWKALRVAQGTGISLPDLEDKAALSQALDEAAGSAMVGEDEVTLYQEVKGLHDEFWRKNGDPRKPIQDQRSTVEDLESEVQGLEGQLQDLEQDIERIEQIQGELEDLESEEKELAQLREEWQEKLEEVEELERSAEDAEGRLELAMEQLDRAEGRLERRKQLIENLEEAKAELEDTEEELEAYAPDLEEAQEELESAKDALTKAKDEHAEAEELERLRRKDLEHLDRQATIEDLQDKIDQVGDAKQERDEARETLAEIAVDDELVAEIRDQTYAVKQKQDRLEEGGPTLRIEPRQDLSVTLDGDDRELADGEELETAISDEARIDVPDILALTVEAGTSTSELRQELEEAEQELEETLSDAGVEDLDDAIDQLGTRNQAINDKERAEERISEVLGDRSLDELEDEIASLASESERYLEQRPEEPPLPEDRQVAKKAHREAEETLEEAKEALGEAEDRRDNAQEALEARRKKHHDLTTERSVAENRVEELEDEIEEAREEASDEEVEDAVEEKTKAAEEAREAYEKAVEEFEQADPESVQAKAENAKKSHKRAREEVSELKQELTRRRARVEAKGGEGIYEQLEHTRLELANERRDLASLEREAKAVRLLFEVLDEERSRAKKAYVQPLKKKLDHLGQIVYGSSFEAHISEDLEIQGRTLDGTTLPFEDLSGGAKEQLSILLRLACAKIVADEGDGVPLLLDDALGYTDPDNLEAMGAVLSTVADDYQLLILTCIPDRYRHVGNAEIERMR